MRARCVAVAREDDRAAWLEARREFLTASDVGAVMGTNRWKKAVDVYREKIHGAPEIRGNPHIERGRRLEPRILRAWAGGDGFCSRPVRRCRALGTLYRSVGYPWLAATPDAVARVQGQTWLVEIKAPSKIRDPYPHYYDQVACQMMVTGVPRAFLVQGVEEEDGLRLAMYRLELDPKRESEIAERTRLFVEGVRSKCLSIEFF